MSNEKNFSELENLPFVLSITDLCAILGVGKNAAYALVRSGQIKTIQVGERKKITKPALITFLNAN